ncbi:oxidoreductase [Kitasatospora herbaricolor]|uniref:Gfo/Idh/MocA family protein n=1 Tax=Kitasatospora herbaricolor TaxID=68217 RepID=UPI00174E8155|nr:Gfo/Idh/MocA family oxidoreductase [Kitasatospora herbaricolor]MDQ0307125.1 putative dehydrogenase [Kitasatospora herbaricolor]GGV29119.1 oxidoreductase [Kitasatospora herbaricolor]
MTAPTPHRPANAAAHAAGTLGSPGTPPVRWGILATGAIATAFAEDLALLPDARLTAVASRTEESARRFAERHDIPRAYGSWEQLAKDPEVDVVYVATPHAQHHAATSLLLAAGKPVLCEKPFTLNLPEAQDLVRLAREHEVFLMEAMWTYLDPAVRRLTQLIDDGAIGEVRTVQAEFAFAAEPGGSGRLRDPAAGGGALLDIGVYPLAFAQLLLGTPDSVQAWGRIAPDGVDDNTGILLGHPGGAHAVLSCSIVSDSAQRAEIGGSLGRIEIPRDFYRPDSFVLHRRRHEPEEFRFPREPGHGYRYEAAEVMRCLRAGAAESPLVPLDGTLALMGTLDTVRRRIGLRYPGDRD